MCGYWVDEVLWYFSLVLIVCIFTASLSVCAFSFWYFYSFLFFSLFKIFPFIFLLSVSLHSHILLISMHSDIRRIIYYMRIFFLWVSKAKAKAIITTTQFTCYYCSIFNENAMVFLAEFCWTDCESQTKWRVAVAIPCFLVFRVLSSVSDWIDWNKSGSVNWHKNNDR